MLRLNSDSGIATQKYPIPKAPYSRPQKEKLMCNLCDKYPNGFRGDHELRRHQKLLHSTKRSAWICIDASEDGKKLSKCRHCREKKQYGAYYNAAAHLRRCHFNPKQGGRKKGGASDRAGKGGGSQPPMEELKSKWIQEIENVPNDANADDGNDDDDDDEYEDEEEGALAEQMAQEEVDAEDQQSHGLSFDGSSYNSSLPLNMNGFMTVADAGIFGYGGYDYTAREPVFDGCNPAHIYDDELVFGFEPPPHATEQQYLR